MKLSEQAAAAASGAPLILSLGAEAAAEAAEAAARTASDADLAATSLMSEEATNLRAELEVASEASKASEAAMDALRAEAAEAVRRRREALQAALQQLAVQRAWAYDLPESPQPQPTLPEPNLEETRGLDDDEVNGSLPGGEAAKKVDGTEGKADETADETMVAQVEEKAEDVVDESNAVVEMPKDRGVDDHRDGRTVAAAVAAAVASALVTVGDEAAARQEVAVAAAVAAGHVVTKEATRRADERAATDVRESVRAEVLEEIRLGALMTASSMVPFTPFPSGYFAREAAVAAVVDSRGRDAGWREQRRPRLQRAFGHDHPRGGD